MIAKIVESTDKLLLCIHCKIRFKNRRGLCGICYYNKNIRNTYPKTYNTIFSRVMPDPVGWSRGLPLPAPTRAKPGTEEKIKVMIERLEKRENLWHPQDRHLDDEEKLEINRDEER